MVIRGKWMGGMGKKKSALLNKAYLRYNKVLPRVFYNPLLHVVLSHHQGNRRSCRRESEMDINTLPVERCLLRVSSKPVLCPGRLVMSGNCQQAPRNRDFPRNLGTHGVT